MAQCNVSKAHIQKILIVDHQLRRFNVSEHAKVAVEFLYLETGAKPVKFVIKSRRLNYLKEIHNREDNELISRGVL